MAGRLQAHQDVDNFIMEARNGQMNDKSKMVFIEMRSNSNIEDAMTPANQPIKIMRTSSFIHLSAISEDGRNWITFDTKVGEFVQHPGTTNEEVQNYRQQIEQVRLQYIDKLKTSYDSAKIYRGSAAPVAGQ